MDGVIKTPPLRHTSNIYKKEVGEGKNHLREKSYPQKGEGDEVVPPLKVVC